MRTVVCSSTVRAPARILVAMRRPLWPFGTVAVLAGLVLSVPAGGSAAAPHNSAGAVCGPPAARTLAGNAVARVYASGGKAYGCARGTRSYELGMTGYSIGAPHIEAVRVAGRIAAYGLRTSGVDTGYATMNVIRLTTGKLLAQRPATTRAGVEGFQSIDSLVIKSDGAVAWIATARSIGMPTFIRQLQRLDERGFRLLDFGPNVAAASLALHGSTLSWKHGTAVRTATLR
jgi:hypothetical protein